MGDPAQCLAVLAELFERGEYEKIACFSLPHLHPLLQHLRKGNCIAENRYFDVSGWRVRIINLHSTLQKLVPLFEKRLADSKFAAWQGNLLLDAGEQQATVHIERGKVSIGAETPSDNILRGGAEIARFLIGSDDAEEIVQQEGITCPEQTLELVKVLFPNLHPMLSHWDEY